MNTPTTEPAALYTGDTWAWLKSLPDYPASAGWVLRYILINTLGRIELQATAQGDSHSISVAPATTGAYAAGLYTWQSYVELGAARYTIATGSVNVRAGYAGGTGGAEARSLAQIALQEALNALATYTASRGLIAEYTIGGRTQKFRSIADIMALINFWRGEVGKETLLPGSGKKILTRFGT